MIMEPLLHVQPLVQVIKWDPTLPFNGFNAIQNRLELYNSPRSEPCRREILRRSYLTT